MAARFHAEAGGGSNPDPSADPPPAKPAPSRVKILVAVALTLASLTFAGYRYYAWQRSENDLLAHALELSGGRAALPVFNLDDLAVPRESIQPGGPIKDGIPSLTTADALPPDQRDPKLHGDTPPRFLPAADLDSLEPGIRVVGVTFNSAARAYPVQVLDWHECINDVVGGIPIAVIYCPLCDSFTVVDRRLDGRLYEFGISGLLHNSNVLLYDRTDDALWSQVGMRAVSGPNVNRSLTHLDGWEITTLAQWIAQHPDTDVLTFDTGHDRDYNWNAYDFYFEHDELAFPIQRHDDRLAPKTRVIGVRFGEQTRAYPLTAIAQAPDGVLRDQLAENAEVILSVSESGAVRIDQVPTGASAAHTFWYAWAALHPKTELFEPPQP